MRTWLFGHVKTKIYDYIIETDTDRVSRTDVISINIREILSAFAKMSQSVLLKYKFFITACGRSFKHSLENIHYSNFY